MPRVKIERVKSTDSPKDVTTRSKAKSKELSSPPVLKKRKLTLLSNTKPVGSKEQPKKQNTGIENSKINENSRQNKTTKNSNGKSITKDDNDNNNKNVEQKPNQNKRIIIRDDSSIDSNDDNDYNSEDDYSPDTEDEEEYRSRSYFW